ncbi:hypothetical protein RJ40_02410 [Methanofollis aquaemaris]|uniref:Uncharacterized protein n=1 Tax=Methanofollis aquaemaris TaxID=126734 RepID=A0A8A3S436_9EURY|nr:hypothetical protein [Methanofollis aquaemaris]QSZ66430.1 hypothetical protein RJ40_02410 [Methanofollis aquaemaris]
MTVPAGVAAVLQAAYKEIVAWYDARPSCVHPDGIQLKTSSIVLVDEAFVDVALLKINEIAQRYDLNWSVDGTLDDWVCHVVIWPRIPSKLLEDSP